MKDNEGDGGDGFLSRWSRRKREAARAEVMPETAGDGHPGVDEPSPSEPPTAEPEPAMSEADLAALPRLEDFTETTDLSGFLRPGVPAALKNAALRRMWMLSPAIRDYRDPAVDYAWDWNTPGGVPGDGCAPSAEAAARMLRDLVSPRQKPTETADAEAGTQAPSESDATSGESPRVPLAAGDAETAATTTISTPRETFSRSEDTVPVKSAAPQDVAALEAPSLAAQPRKRHGRALPS